MTLSQLKTVTGALYRIQRSLNNQLSVNQSSGNDAWNSGSLSLRRNAANDGVALTSNGRAFQARAPASYVTVTLTTFYKQPGAVARIVFFFYRGERNQRKL